MRWSARRRATPRRVFVGVLSGLGRCSVKRWSAGIGGAAIHGRRTEDGAMNGGERRRKTRMRGLGRGER